MSDGQPELASTEAWPKEPAAAAPPGSAFGREDLARELAAGSRLFWCIAAGVLGSPAQAEDVVQEAAVIGLAKLASFEPGTSFQAWMGQIVRNVARNQARRGARTEAAELPEGLAAPGAHGPASPAEADRRDLADPGADYGRHFDDRVVAALKALSDTARVCLLLRTVLDLDYAEIAATLGIPEGTAMSHVHRSRHRMRSLLEGAG